MYYFFGSAVYDLFDFFSTIYGNSGVTNTTISVTKGILECLQDNYLSYSDENAKISSGKHWLKPP